MTSISNQLSAALEALKEMLEKKHGQHEASKLMADIQFFSWPDIFGSTSGPRGGVGGNAITERQTFAFVLADGTRLKINSGVVRHWRGGVQERW